MRNENAAAIWSRIAAPLPAGEIQWRQDGKIVSRDGKHYARFVAYVDAQFVQRRLDSVVPGEWDLTLELLPSLAGPDGQPECCFKARLSILGVIREDVGQGGDYKSAATDAFKRAAVRFGIAAELYAMEQNWVRMDGDGKYAKPLEDPAAAYARRYGKPVPVPKLEAAEGATSAVPARHEPYDEYAGTVRSAGPRELSREAAENEAVGQWERQRQAAGGTAPAAEAEEPDCPKCGGRMWDNRLLKRNPKAPDFKCRDRACDGVIWPPKEPAPQRPGEPKPRTAEDEGSFPAALMDEVDSLPF